VVSLGPGMDTFLSTPDPQKFDLCLNKHNTLTAERKWRCFNWLKRLIWRNSYNLSHILEKIADSGVLKQITLKDGTQKEWGSVELHKLHDRLREKTDSYGDSNPKQWENVKGLFERVTGSFRSKFEEQQVQELHKLLQDEEMREMLPQYGIDITPPSTKEEALKRREKIESILFRVGARDQRQSPVTLSKTSFIEQYQRDFISFFSSCVERSDGQTDQEYVEKIQGELASGKLSSITSLNLTYKTLGYVPEEIKYLTGLEELCMHGCLVAKLPGEIGALVNLKTLEVSGNHLTELPREIGGLAKLETLRAGKNSLTTLPEEIGSLSSLENLSLRGNKLVELPKGICNLKKLRSIDCADNKLAELPTGIGNLINLEELDVEGNELTKLPVEIAGLVKLETLNVDKNQLVELPEGLGQLVRLRSINCSRNKLVRLPEDIGELVSLTSLCVSSNSLTCLPDSLANLTALERLLLSWNPFTVFPTVIERLPNLKRLDLYDVPCALPLQIGNLFFAELQCVRPKGGYQTMDQIEEGRNHPIKW